MQSLDVYLFRLSLGISRPLPSTWPSPYLHMTPASGHPLLKRSLHLTLFQNRRLQSALLGKLPPNQPSYRRLCLTTLYRLASIEGEWHEFESKREREKLRKKRKVEGHTQ